MESGIQGNDPDKAVNNYRVAVGEVGADKVRCIKSDGEKDDGTTKWALVKVPPDTRGTTEDDDDFDIMRDWFGTPFKAAGTMIFFAFALYVVVELFSSDEAEPKRREKSQTVEVSKPKTPARPKAIVRPKISVRPRLPELETQLESYMREGGPTNMNSVEGMNEMSAYMTIVGPQLEGGRFGSEGAEIETLKTTTVEKGTIRFNGRNLPAGIVPANAQAINRAAGKRFGVCLRMGGAVDKSFQVVRSIAFFDCQGSAAALSEWANKIKYMKQ